MDWGGIKMKMHQIIARQRRAMGLTQEQLAERLGVTAPAVNKWEKGSTCPDVALLPPLARLLGIDMNELFCFHEDLSDSETSRMVQEVSAVFKREGAQAAFTLAQKYLRSYPNCEALSYGLAVCLDAIFRFEGVMRDSQHLLDQGMEVLDILQQGLEDRRILDLRGCSLDVVLYYPDREIPVLAVQNDGSAVLVTGFNEQNVVIMNPVTGTLSKMGMNDAREWFEENGNRFIAYW